jgi:hypothetical protein
LPWLTAEEIDLPEDYDETALNEYFDIAGFGTKQFIKNLGSTLIFMAIITALFLLIPLYQVLTSCTGR